MLARLVPFRTCQARLLNCIGPSAWEINIGIGSGTTAATDHLIN
jgi:hypothetical protein